MAWFSVRSLPQATSRPQVQRRHLQRRHAHFHGLRSDWTVFRSWPLIDLDAPRRSQWIVALALLVAVLGGWMLFPFVVRNQNLAPTVAAEIRVSLPPTPIETFEVGRGDDRIALIDGIYTPLSEATRWTSVTVEHGQTLADIFAEFGISSRQLARIVANVPSSDSFMRLRPGERIGIRRAEDGSLTALQFEVDVDTRRIVEIDGDRVTERTFERPLERRLLVASGRIVGSLFGAGEEAGLDDATILKLAKVFGYDIDFARDLRRGDRFTVIYEMIYRDGEAIQGGEIIAATFVNRGRRFDAFRFTMPDGGVEYFDHSGRPLRKAFIRTPLEFSRISSRFSSARRHPILGTVRAHKGVDYAAPSGTPVMAAADGRVRFAGWKNGYGRVIELDHGGGYSTLYAHLSRFATNVRAGARVRQGEIIGYVGKSGLATAPHLHYEFRVHGRHRDPLRVTLPPPKPLPEGLMAKFRSVTAPYVRQLARAEARDSITLAQH